MKIALYKDIESRHYSTSVCDAKVFEGINSYARLSEIVDVDFKMLNNGESEKKEIAFIDKQINQEMAESESRLNILKQRRQELLAIGSE